MKPLYHFSRGRVVGYIDTIMWGFGSNNVLLLLTFLNGFGLEKEASHIGYSTTTSAEVVVGYRARRSGSMRGDDRYYVGFWIQ